MKFYKQKENKYYKYVIADWTQPLLSSNTSEPSFVVSHSSGRTNVYYLFDNNTSTGVEVHTSAGSFSGKDYYFEMKSTNGLNVTNMAVTNRKISGQSIAITAGSVQVSNDGKEWVKITDWTNSNTGAGATWNIPLSYEGYYKYIRLCITNGYSNNSGNWVLVNQLVLTATQQQVIESTEDDYDYIIKGDAYYLPRLKKRKYYKYFIEDFAQPILTSNNSNPNFIVSNHKGGDAYKCFDGSNSTIESPHTAAGSFSGKNYWFQMVCKNGLNVTNIKVTNRNPGDGYGQAITAGSIQVSHDGVEWVKITDWTNSNKGVGASWNIPVSYDGFYKYIRLCITSGVSNHTANWLGIANIQLTATEKVPKEWSRNGSDFYEDIDTYYGITG